MLEAATKQLAGDAAVEGRKTASDCRVVCSTLALRHATGVTYSKPQTTQLFALPGHRIQARSIGSTRRHASQLNMTESRRSAKECQTASYRVHLRLAEGKGPSLGYWCMVPGVAMKILQALGARSILLTSGTLSPLESFAHELVRWQRLDCTMLARLHYAHAHA